MTYLIALLTVFGYILNIKNYKLYSYLVWEITNTYWIYHSYTIKEYALTFMFIVYLFLCSYGIIKDTK